MLLLFALGTLLLSIWLTHTTIDSARRLNLGIDEGVGVQKFHSHWVPRLGGVPIFVTLCASLLGLAWVTRSEVTATLALIVCLLPAFGIGLLEDITRRSGVLVRLAFTMISAALGWWLLDAHLQRLDIPYVDDLLLALPVLAFLLTLVAAAGVGHAINIIDGNNGLSGFFVAVIFMSLAWIARENGDAFLCRVAVLAAAATVGFLVWNFPSGRIFMGDAGAYVLGFLIALISILLVRRNPDVSPWCPMLLVMHPVWETLFSMYRRSRYGIAELGRPDALHLHSLIFKRMIKRFGVSRQSEYRTHRNATASLYLWIAALLCAIPAVAFWRDTPTLMGFCLLYAGSYVLLYKKLVRFQMPRSLFPRRADQAAPIRAEELPAAEDLELDELGSPIRLDAPRS